jgi:uncharacterized membrane protein YgaE (UPF0421/DUF939 family)
MTMKRFVLIILVSIFQLGLSSELQAQKNKYQAPKDPVKAAEKREAKESKELDKEIKKVKKAHRKLQGKKTAKRMKRNRKRSARHSSNKKDPLLHRVFSKKNKKKVKEGK